MTMAPSVQRSTTYVILSAALLGVLGGVAAATLTPAYLVSQRDQAFRPGQVAVRRGETVRIVNDDGDLLHHSYVESSQFNFDSGDQEPGAKVDISFPISGAFTVLCGIHPRMKLLVRVE